MQQNLLFFPVNTQSLLNQYASFQGTNCCFNYTWFLLLIFSSRFIFSFINIIVQFYLTCFLFQQNSFFFFMHIVSTISILIIEEITLSNLFLHFLHSFLGKFFWGFVHLFDKTHRIFCDKSFILREKTYIEAIALCPNKLICIGVRQWFYFTQKILFWFHHPWETKFVSSPKCDRFLRDPN